MDKKEVYIGSISPTIDLGSARTLIQTTQTLAPLLTVEELKYVMTFYANVCSRVLKENNMEGKDEITCIKQR